MLWLESVSNVSCGVSANTKSPASRLSFAITPSPLPSTSSMPYLDTGVSFRAAMSPRKPPEGIPQRWPSFISQLCRSGSSTQLFSARSPCDEEAFPRAFKRQGRKFRSFGWGTHLQSTAHICLAPSTLIASNQANDACQRLPAEVERQVRSYIVSLQRAKVA